MTKWLPKFAIVLGGGTMGSGIANWLAQKGLQIAVIEPSNDIIARSKNEIASSLNKLESKNKIKIGDAAIFQKAIHYFISPDDVPDDFKKDTDLLIEAVFENKELKQQLFANWDKILPAKTIFASNTSSFLIGSLGKDLSPERKQNFLGIHFFNPAPVMPLVEIILPSGGSQTLQQQIIEWLDARGKTPVPCKDAPGFMVNRIARNFYGEAYKIARYEDQERFLLIDQVMRQVGTFKMGPFELMDLIGVDVNLAVSESVYSAFYGEERFRPGPIQRLLVESGRHGKKCGRGHYTYPRPEVPEEAQTASTFTFTTENCLVLVDRSPANDFQTQMIAKLKNCSVTLMYFDQHWSLEDGREHYFDFQYIFDLTIGGKKHKNKLLSYFETHLPKSQVISELTLVWADRFFDKFKNLIGGLSLLFPAPGLAREFHARSGQSNEPINAFYQLLGLHPICLPEGAPGFIFPRILSMIINEAYYAVEENLGTNSDIDLAMEKGVNYPIGPLQWARRIGPKYIALLLKELLVTTGEVRYRPCLSLYRHSDRYFGGLR